MWYGVTAKIFTQLITRTHIYNARKHFYLINVLFFCSVPKDERFTKWLAAFQTLNNQENICKSGRVCSKHFLEDDFLSKAKRFRLKKDAVPSIFRRTTITNNNTGADAVIAEVAEAASLQ